MNYDVIKTIICDKPITYHPAIAKAVGSVNAGIFLSQLLYWTGKGNDPEWIYKTQKEFEDETALSRREQEGARTILGKLGVLEEKRKGIPARLFYRANIDRLIELLSAQRKREQGADPEADILDCTKPPICDGENRQSNSESTTENTKEGPQNNETIAVPPSFSPSGTAQKRAVKPSLPSPPPPPQITLFFRTIGKKPPKALYQQVIDIIVKKQDQVFMRCCYEEWLVRGYNPQNLKWLTEWYVNGIIPDLGGQQWATERKREAAQKRVEEWSGWVKPAVAAST